MDSTSFDDQQELLDDFINSNEDGPEGLTRRLIKSGIVFLCRTHISYTEKIFYINDVNDSILKDSDRLLYCTRSLSEMANNILQGSFHYWLYCPGFIRKVFFKKRTSLNDTPLYHKQKSLEYMVLATIHHENYYIGRRVIREGKEKDVLKIRKNAEPHLIARSDLETIAFAPHKLAYNVTGIHSETDRAKNYMILEKCSKILKRHKLVFKGTILGLILYIGLRRLLIETKNVVSSEPITSKALA